MPEPLSPPPLVNEIEAARILGLSAKTLRRWRWAGKPELPFHKIGAAVRYDPQELKAYLANQVRCSTSDPGPERRAERGQ